MNRVLFVDDEPRILDGLRDLLRRHRTRWDLRFAVGPEAALEEIAAASFDTVLTDMRMPRMDGAELLGRVKDACPGAVRIVLSGQMGADAVLRAIPVAHQFVAKPCESSLLEAVIGRSCGDGPCARDVRLRRVVAQADRLWSDPHAFAALIEVLDRPAVAAADVAEVIDSDPGLCARTLQVVNSAFFGQAHALGSTRHAVAFVGVGAIRALALAPGTLGVQHADPLAWVQEARRRGRRIGQVTRLIAPADPDDAFTAGLLQDVGRLVLADGLPEEYAAVRARAAATGVPLACAEVDALGAHHGDVGGRLLEVWGLPASIVHAVRMSHAPWPDAAGGPPLSRAAHLAGALVDEIECEEVGGSDAGAYLDGLGLGADLPWLRRVASAAVAALP